MMKTNKAWIAGLVTAGTLAFGAAHTVRAATYTETGDAGQTLATAQNAGAATGFSGTLGTAQDADLFQFTVGTAGTYSFSDVNALTIDTTAGGQLDSAMFLFDGQGHALLTNDDAAGGAGVTSQFSATLAVGTYYFGISESGNEPVNTANQLLFAGYPSGDTTATRGPAAGVNPSTESTFNALSYTPDLGSYSVSITAVPEPSTWAALLLGGAASLGFAARRRRSVA